MTRHRPGPVPPPHSLTADPILALILSQLPHCLIPGQKLALVLFPSRILLSPIRHRHPSRPTARICFSLPYPPLPAIDADLFGLHEPISIHYSFLEGRREYPILSPAEGEPSQTWNLHELFVFMCDLDRWWKIDESGHRRGTNKEHSSEFFQFVLSSKP
jgi:hypothetical protein